MIIKCFEIIYSAMRLLFYLSKIMIHAFNADKMKVLAKENDSPTRLAKQFFGIEFIHSLKWL